MRSAPVYVLIVELATAVEAAVDTPAWTAAEVVLISYFPDQRAAAVPSARCLRSEMMMMIMMMAHQEDNLEDEA